MGAWHLRTQPLHGSPPRWHCSASPDPEKPPGHHPPAVWKEAQPVCLPLLNLLPSARYPRPVLRTAPRCSRHSTRPLTSWHQRLAEHSGRRPPAPRDVLMLPPHLAPEELSARRLGSLQTVSQPRCRCCPSCPGPSAGSQAAEVELVWEEGRWTFAWPWGPVGVGLLGPQPWQTWLEAPLWEASAWIAPRAQAQTQEIAILLNSIFSH